MGALPIQLDSIVAVHAKVVQIQLQKLKVHSIISIQTTAQFSTIHHRKGFQISIQINKNTVLI